MSEVFMTAPTKNNTRFEKTKFFLLGMFVVIAFITLSGAYGNTPGRYQLETWGAGGVGFGAFVIDTVSGETKIVYLNTGMTPPQTNYLGVSFEEIKTEAALGRKP
jgi:hypothetical protein